MHLPLPQPSLMKSERGIVGTSMHCTAHVQLLLRRGCVTCKQLTFTMQVTDASNSVVTPRLNLRAAMSASCTPKISPSSIKADATGGTFTLTVTPPATDCAWSLDAQASDTGIEWMRIVGLSNGTGPGTVTVQIDPQPQAGAASRSVGLSVEYPRGGRDLLVNVLVSQGVTAPSSDVTAPTMLRQVKAASSGGGQVTVTWPAASDAGQGVSNYKVVYVAGRRQPSPRCVTGEPAVILPVRDTGSSLSRVVQGLTVGTVYTFRVCPIDAAGNVATGHTARAVVA